MTAPTVPCTSCAAPVVQADVLLPVIDQPRRARREPLAVDPLPKLLEPDPALMLHVSTDLRIGRWLLTPLDSPTVTVLLRAIRLPHTHRMHVCATIPADWPAIALPTQTAASTS